MNKLLIELELDHFGQSRTRVLGRARPNPKTNQQIPYKNFKKANDRKMEYTGTRVVEEAYGDLLASLLGERQAVYGRRDVVVGWRRLRRGKAGGNARTNGWQRCCASSAIVSITENTTIG
jgi:hypothetical protein